MAESSTTKQLRESEIIVKDFVVEEGEDQEGRSSQVVSDDCTQVTDYLQDYLATRYQQDRTGDLKGRRRVDTSPGTNQIENDRIRRLDAVDAKAVLRDVLNSPEPSPQVNQCQQGCYVLEDEANLPEPPPQRVNQALPGAYPQAPTGAPVQASDEYLYDNLHEEYDAEEASTSTTTMDNDTGLVQARRISVKDQPVSTAQPLDMEAQQDRSKEPHNSYHTTYQIAGLAGCCIIVLLLVGLVIFLTGKGENSSTSNDTSPATSSNQTQVPVGTIALDLPMTLPQPTIETILADATGKTPQFRAYQWLKNDPNLANYTDNESRLIQRFVAACFFYATGGESWTNRGGDTVNILMDVQSSPHQFSAGGGNQQATNTISANSATTASYPGNSTLPPASPNANIEQMEIVSAEWLSYDSDECDWFNTATTPTKKLKPFCDERGRFLNFDFQKNNLTGSTPPEVGLLSGLQTLKLGWSSLQGTLPTELGWLTHLEQLRIFRGQVRGPIPSQLGLLSNSLWAVSLIQNQLSGNLPSELWQLSRLKQLQFDRNKLSGSLPVHIGIQMPHLEMLRANKNLLSSSLPSTLGLCTNLLIIDLEQNQMTGSIPSELGQLINMTRLELHDNPHLMGFVPSELGLLPVLEELVLENNGGLSGTIPLELENLNDTLTVLNIAGTTFSGTIPETLCKIDKLSFDCSLTLCGCGCPC